MSLYNSRRDSDGNDVVGDIIDNSGPGSDEDIPTYLALPGFVWAGEG